MSIIHINRSRAQPDPGRAERGEAIWCFRCRKRLPGTYDLMIEPMGSYYDNWWRYRCDGCDESHRFFPGCEPDDGYA